MLGYAWQKGWVPISLDALMRAVELNAAAVEMNKTAFNWGRMAAHDIDVGACGRQLRRLRRPSRRTPMPLRSTMRAISRTLDERDRAPRRVPDRLPERRVRATVQGARRQGARRRAAEDARLHVADRSRRALRVQADGVQGRIRSRAALHERRFRKAHPRDVRRRLQAAFQSRAAAVREEGCRRPSAQGRVRRVGVQRVQAAGEAERPARNGVRRVRLHRRAQERAPARSPTTSRRSTSCSRRSITTTTRSRSRSRRFRSRSAATATSRSGILLRR